MAMRKSDKVWLGVIGTFLVLVCSGVLTVNAVARSMYLVVNEEHEVEAISDMLIAFASDHDGNLPTGWDELKSTGLCREGGKPFSMINSKWRRYIADIRKFNIAFGLKGEDISISEASDAESVKQVLKRQDGQPFLLIAPTRQTRCGLGAYRRNSLRVAEAMQL